MTDVIDTTQTLVSTAALWLDVVWEVERLTQFLRDGILHTLHRRGVVVGCSGGIDSSVVLALCARALGPERVVALLMPERESSPESAVLAQALADQLGVAAITEDLTGALEGAGCYRRRDEAIRRVFPEFDVEWKSKITLPGGLLDLGTLNVFYLTIIRPDGQEFRRRLPAAEYAQIVASSNFKQRMRMTTLYYHAELRHFAVVGTAQKNEHDLGFFVKYGDGGVDINPIRHLYKSQVYQLAEYLEVPAAIQARTPTTDTYSAGSTQEEFFFRMPFAVLDVVWAGHEQGRPIQELAAALQLSVAQVERAIDDIKRKERTTEYLRASVLAF